MYTDKNGKQRYTLAERYNYHKKIYETGKVTDRNGEVHTLGKVARAREGVRCANLLDRIERSAFRNYVSNTYANGNNGKKTNKKK